MTFWAIIMLSIITAGTFFIRVAARRVQLTAELQDRLVQAADALWQEAVDADQSSDLILIKIHNMMITLAAALPGISLRIIKASSDTSIETRELKDAKTFLKRNAWVVPYVATSYFIVKRIEFTSEPWRVSTWKSALIGWFLMTYLKREDGVIRIVEDVNEVGMQVEEIDRIQSTVDLPLVPA